MKNVRQEDEMLKKSVRDERIFIVNDLKAKHLEKVVKELTEVSFLGWTKVVMINVRERLVKKLVKTLEGRQIRYYLIGDEGFGGEAERFDGLTFIEDRVAVVDNSLLDWLAENPEVQIGALKGVETLVAEYPPREFLDKMQLYAKGPLRPIRKDALRMEAMSRLMQMTGVEYPLVVFSWRGGVIDDRGEASDVTGERMKQLPVEMERIDEGAKQLSVGRERTNERAKQLPVILETMCGVGNRSGEVFELYPAEWMREVSWQMKRLRRRRLMADVVTTGDDENLGMIGGDPEVTSDAVVISENLGIVDGENVAVLTEEREVVR